MAYDAQLHILRSAARAISANDTRAGHYAETARSNLSAALQQCDSKAARRWIVALRMALHVGPLDEQLRDPAVIALAEIETDIAE